VVTHTLVPWSVERLFQPRDLDLDDLAHVLGLLLASGQSAATSALLSGPTGAMNVTAQTGGV
jgi:hypothetical protein